MDSYHYVMEPPTAAEIREVIEAFKVKVSPVKLRRSKVKIPTMLVGHGSKEPIFQLDRRIISARLIEWQINKKLNFAGSRPAISAIDFDANKNWPINKV